jgi:hypothetical protein
MFVVAVLSVIALWKLSLGRAQLTSPTWLRLTTPYAIGSVAMFWVIERVAGF